MGARSAVVTITNTSSNVRDISLSEIRKDKMYFTSSYNNIVVQTPSLWRSLPMQTMIFPRIALDFFRELQLIVFPEYT